MVAVSNGGLAVLVFDYTSMLKSYTYIYELLCAWVSLCLLFFLQKQSYFIQHPFLCTLISVPALLFELSGGVVLLYCIEVLGTGDALFLRSLLFWYAVVGIIFHVGVWLLQGLDFTTYWSPIFLAFITYDNSWKHGGEGQGGGGGGGGWMNELYNDATDLNHPMVVVCVSGVLVYFIGQLVTAITLWDLHQSEVRMLSLMFAVVF